MADYTDSNQVKEMLIDMNHFLLSLSKALDFAEGELVGVESGHAQRVALIVNRMMHAAGHREDQCYAASAAALLHDCALQEYLSDEKELLNQADPEIMERNMGAHCVEGERICSHLPFYSLVEGAVLYHHERADGAGTFGKTAYEIPDYCQFLHIADLADVYAGLRDCTKEKLSDLRTYLIRSRGTVFCERCVDLFNEVIDDAFLSQLSGTISPKLLMTVFPQEEMEISTELLKEMSMIFADITDYKSHFTWRHSTGIAEKAAAMGNYYRLSGEECRKLYIAGLLHDIGKLLIPNTILEKPGKLDADEYRVIQNHAIGTWDLLKNIRGMEDIASWAALHHEKLDGSGYPFGYTAERLSRNERLMACIDIYQALTEERPYKEGLSHSKSMDILFKMGRAGQLDMDILNDIDACFAPASPEEKAAETEAPAEKTIEEKPVQVPSASGPVYRCPVCGYIYEGELPEDFICPRCEQPASVFEKIQ